MMFLINADTQPKHWCEELVIIDVWILKGGNSEKQESSFDYDSINGGPPILIHVFTLTYLLPGDV